MMHVYIVNLLNLFVVAILLASYMLILSLPVLSVALINVLLDLVFNTILLDPSFNGDPVFYQHLFFKTLNL